MPPKQTHICTYTIETHHKSPTLYICYEIYQWNIFSKYSFMHQNIFTLKNPKSQRYRITYMAMMRVLKSVNDKLGNTLIAILCVSGLGGWFEGGYSFNLYLLYCINCVRNATFCKSPARNLWPAFN